MCRYFDDNLRLNSNNTYTVVAKIPNINPNILPILDILPLYNLLDSGNSSPETIYNIAPAANARHSDITSLDIVPQTCSKECPYPCCNTR